MVAWVRSICAVVLVNRFDFFGIRSIQPYENSEWASYAPRSFLLNIKEGRTGAGLCGGGSRKFTAPFFSNYSLLRIQLNICSRVGSDLQDRIRDFRARCVWYKSRFESNPNYPPSGLDMTRLEPLLKREQLVKFASRILVPTCCCDAIDASAIRTHQDQKIKIEGATQLAPFPVVLSQPDLELYSSFVELNGNRCCTCTETTLNQASLRQFSPCRLSTSPLSFIVPLRET